MSIIVVGDIQIQNQEPQRSSCLKFLQWLLENHKDDTILQAGDFFDKSSIHHNLTDEVLEILMQFKDFRILSGNHDFSDRLGNILKPWRHYNNITIYTKQTEFEIDGISFIVLPSLPYNEKEEYEKIEGQWDYSICHFTPIQEAFGGEGIELKFKTNIAHLFAHIHRHREFIDNFGNKALITGSVINYRYGEQEWEKNIYKITKEGYEKIKVPFFFTYETLEFGQEPSDPNNILNIKEVPSWEELHKKYGNYNIRREGLEFIQTEENLTFDRKEFEHSDLAQKFNIFSIDAGIPKNVEERCYYYINKFKDQDEM
jgi:hypothetical protein